MVLKKFSLWKKREEKEKPQGHGGMNERERLIDLFILEDILKHEYLPGWKLLLDKLTGFFNGRWGDNWQRSDEKFWKEFKEKIVSKK